MIKIGNATITPIIELDAGDVIQDIIPKATKENVLSIDWLQPHFADKEGNLKATVQSLLIEINGKRILVDTCIGNGRKRPELPEWDNLNTTFLTRLQSVCSPGEIDIVICTHLHFDHIGWSTTLKQGKWIPTFPNARYVLVKDEFEYWEAQPEAEIVDDKNGIDESVLPIHKAGLVDLVSVNHQVTEGISLFPTPGHTPYHVSLLIESAGQSAVITGDVIHHPIQIAHPDWMSFDTDEKQAFATRQAFLERFANTETLIIGSHFADPVAGKIARSDGSFAFRIQLNG